MINFYLIVYRFIEKPDQLTVTLATPILKPEQFLDLFYYIARLLDPKSLEPSLVLSTSSGKCYSCENESCSCLTHSVSIGYSYLYFLLINNIQ